MKKLYFESFLVTRYLTYMDLNELRAKITRSSGKAMEKNSEDYFAGLYSAYEHVLSMLDDLQAPQNLDPTSTYTPGSRGAPTASLDPLKCLCKEPHIGYSEESPYNRFCLTCGVKL